MLTLHYAPGACSLVPHIMLEEIGAPFTAKRMSLAASEHRTPEYLALNPHARVPTLVEDDFVLTETPAILSYLGHRFAESGMLPLADLRAMARCEELLAFFSSSVHVAVAQIWRTARYTEDPSAHEAIRAGGRKNLLGHFAEIDALAEADWLVGDRITIADLYPLIFYRWGLRLDEPMGHYAAWTRHAARMLERPAVQRAIEAEGLSPLEFQPARAAA